MFSYLHIRRLKRRVKSNIFRHLYRDPGGGLENTLIVAGAARSGTTWLAEVFASQTPTRLIFEPFYPDRVPEYRGFSPMEYVAPGRARPKLRRVVEEILHGRVRGPWVDHQIDCLRPNQRIVKAVRANLMLAWLSQEFSAVPIVFLIRHPCAVVSSRIAAQWNPDDDLDAIQNQPELGADFLAAKENILEDCSSVPERHALAWSIQHLVPLTQLCPTEVHLVFYENLVLRPQDELPRLFSSIGHTYRSSLLGSIDLPSRKTPLPSMTRARADRATHWQSELDSDQQKAILRVTHRMGLSHLYDNSLSPLTDSKNAFLS